MERSTFIFDTNKCVACMACVAGCSIENEALSAINWRKVDSFNSLRHPKLPVFHFSLACNHCLEAPCKDNCPTLAYHRDPETGAILHHAEACIGCKYCTWACPYDAPKYNPDKGIIEKCTFCVDLISNDGQPACSAACPVDALSFGYENPENDLVVPGFVNKNIRPSIKIVPLRENSVKPKIYCFSQSDDSLHSSKDLQIKPKSKVRIAHEWPLIIFSLSIASLIGWYSAHLRIDLEIPIFWFTGLGVAASLLSLLHLGKKFRAWRSVLNIRRSWLSREIFTLTGFLFFGTSSLLFSSSVLDIVSIIFGVSCLVSIDMIYHIVKRPENMNTHSAMVLLTGFMVFSLLTNSVFLIGFTLSVKLGLYLFRKIQYRSNRINTLPIISVVRICCLLIPFIYLGTNWMPGLDSWMILLFVGLGEAIDRLEFYYEAEITTPEGELYEYLKYNLHNDHK